MKPAVVNKNAKENVQDKNKLTSTGKDVEQAKITAIKQKTTRLAMPLCERN
jgi:hypothetical protein